MNSAYLDQIHRNLPRLLACFDSDTTSDTYGVGDRYYWGWKLIDFPNGTFQAAAAGLAGLLAADALPAGVSSQNLLEKIDSIVMATKKVMANNGSLAEAFPNEASFCVTGLVAGDLLLALERLDSLLSPAQKQRWLNVIEPLITFLFKQDEYHGLISNHLATNALALVRWTNLSGKNADSRARLWVDRILDHQSPEGWFKEYEGADPGYQTWCTSSLAAIHQLRPDWGLAKPLQQSLDFLSYAAHPDGSFGGLYGSRMTRFIFPAGLQILADCFPGANHLSKFAHHSISQHACVTLDAIDPPNFAPLFNDYVTALLHQSTSNNELTSKNLPCHSEPFRREFPESGWVIDRGPHHYTVLNLRKGAAGIHIREGKEAEEITGFVGYRDSGKLVSTQFHDNNANWKYTNHCYEITSSLREVKRPKPSPFQFIIIRALSLTLFRNIRAGNAIKKALVHLLVTGQSKSCGHVLRTVKLSENTTIKDSYPMSVKPIDANGFKPIHMASMGYWQKGDK